MSIQMAKVAAPRFEFNPATYIIHIEFG